MNNHAQLSASGSARWINCPGSVGLSKGIPNASSAYAREGTAAHELAAKCLLSQRPASDFLGDVITVEDESFTVDHEMAGNIQMYLDYCNNLEGQNYWVETKIKYTNWVPDGFGTSDYIKINVLYDEQTHTPHHTINVPDLKYGKGVPVSAENNSQSMIYGLGVLQTFSLYYDFKPTDIVNCAIFQPRISDEPSEFKISVGALLKWANDVVVPRAEQALSSGGFFKAGEKQCRWCPAKAFCKTLAEDSIKMASEGFKDFTKPYTLKDKNKLTNTEISHILKKVPQFEIWYKSVEAYAIDQMLAGSKIPDYKLVTGKAGNKKWVTQDVDFIYDELIKIGVPGEELITKKIATPTQVEKIIKSEKLKNVSIEDFWTQSKGKPTIAKRDDKREEIEITVDAGFKAITENV